MATFTDQSKNTSTPTNLPFGGGSMTWDADTNTWSQSDTATWNDPSAVWTTATKDSTSPTNLPKN